ncbi:MAG TPA: murein L,D-transpeptidase catalytic domain family protein [Caulobacteraceae bacterium]|nr:murein L,D-transpeptidase catalytic domain family protein [Caulobacteraceae bacterium]
MALAAPQLVIVAARAGLARADARIRRRDVVGVADFSQPSSAPRLHLVDMASGRVDSLLVAHGRGSDPDHTGWLKRFSNAPGSDCTSQGDYVTADYYVGEHGRSMRLIGLDPSNDNAEPRGIVVHAAWYVGPDMVRAHGMLGRSEGCFAVSQADLETVLGRLGPGRLLVATKL